MKHHIRDKNGGCAAPYRAAQVPTSQPSLQDRSSCFPLEGEAAWAMAPISTRKAVESHRIGGPYFNFPSHHSGMFAAVDSHVDVGHSPFNHLKSHRISSLTSYLRKLYLYRVLSTST